MSKLTFKLGAKGVSRGAKLYIDYDGDSPGMKLSELKDVDLVNEIKSMIKEDLTEDDFEIGYCQDGAYIELIDEESDTHILVVVGSRDHDGNELYIKEVYDEESDTSKLDMENIEVIRELLSGLSNYREDDKPTVEVSEDLLKVTIEQNENMWLDSTLENAIYTLGLEKKYSEEFMTKLKSGYYYTYGPSKEEMDVFDSIDKEVIEAERQFFKLSSLVENHRGSKLVIRVDTCGCVEGFYKVKEYDFKSVAYDINYDIALLKKCNRLER